MLNNQQKMEIIRALAQHESVTTIAECEGVPEAEVEAIASTEMNAISSLRAAMKEAGAL